MRLVQTKGTDLPVAWDGRTVTWQGWDSTPIRLCPPPTDPRCHCCGSTAEQPTNIGLVIPEPGDTMESERTKYTRRSGRAYSVKIEVRAWPLFRLVAFRCPDCGHDMVVDVDTTPATVWDLDSTDYGPLGSLA
jgi:hypothetical protein